MQSSCDSYLGMLNRWQDGYKFKMDFDGVGAVDVIVSDAQLSHLGLGGDRGQITLEAFARKIHEALIAAGIGHVVGADPPAPVEATPEPEEKAVRTSKKPPKE